MCCIFQDLQDVMNLIILLPLKLVLRLRVSCVSLSLTPPHLPAQVINRFYKYAVCECMCVAGDTRVCFFNNVSTTLMSLYT